MFCFSFINTIFYSNLNLWVFIKNNIKKTMTENQQNEPVVQDLRDQEIKKLTEK